MPDNFDGVRQLGQSIWFDNISREFISSGELQRLIDVGVTGLTSNPTIFQKAISGSADYDDSLIRLARDGKNSAEILEALAIEDIQAAADLLRPVYDQTDGVDGYASLEVNPHLSDNTEGTIAEARRLFSLLDRPNVLIKVPATPEGMPAIRKLIGEGINVNITLIFALDAYDSVREAYISGLEDLTASGRDPSLVASVASFFVSRVDTAVDGLLKSKPGGVGVSNEGLISKAAIANAKLAYRNFQEAFGSSRFATLKERGARVQRPLWASTSTKNPALSDVLYVESLIGKDTVNTLPDVTLAAYLDHGIAAETITQGLKIAESTLEGLASSGVDMGQVASKLLGDGVRSFADSYDELLRNIEEKKAQLQTSEVSAN